MKKIVLLFFFASFGSPYIQAQEIIEHFRIAKTHTVRPPLLNDSLDVKGKPVDIAAVCLKTSVPALFDYNEPARICRTDTTGYVRLPVPGKNAEIHLLNFRIRADRFIKGKVVFTSPNRLEVFVNGEKKKDKTSAQDSLSKAQKCEVPLQMEPENTYEITVKLLAMPEEKSNPALKGEWVRESKDSSVRVVWGTDLKKRYLLPNTVFGERAANVSVSPDGNYLLVTFVRNHAPGRSETYTVLADPANGRTICRFGNKTGLGWMPRSGKLYYTVTAATGRDIRSIDPSSFEEETIARNIPEGNFTWSPDETALYYTPSEEIPSDQGPVKRVIDPDDRIPGTRNRWFISRYDLQTGTNERLTAGNRTTSLCDLSRDGQYLLFSTRKANITERPFSLGSLFRLNLETFAVDTLITDEPFLGDAHFSPEGNRILLVAGPEAFGGAGLNCKPETIANDYDKQAYLLDIATRKITPITREFAPSVTFLQWNSADGNIYFSTNDEDCRHIYRYDTGKNKFRRLELDGDVITRFSIARNASQTAYITTSAQSSTKVYTCDLKNGKPSLFSDPMKPVFDDMTLGKTEEWNFSTADGTRIKGMVCYPPEFDANRKYPMIVYYYGGTTPTERNMDSPYAAQLFASRNYVVYVLNPSGAIGFGQEFSARHVNAWGKRTADEIIEGTRQFCREHPFVDTTRIGCLGASYGGFMTQYLQTKTKLFAAAVSHAGISNVTSYWGEGYWGYSYNAVAAADSYPWNNSELFTRQGSLFNAEKITTPLLLLHGTADTNVPIGESIQLFNALKILGRPVAFIQVEGENHFIADYPKRVLWHNSIMAWFARWLQDNPEWWNELYPGRVNE